MRSAATTWLAVAALVTPLAGCERASPSRAWSSPVRSAPVELHFSPHGGCTEAVVALLDGARTTVRMQAYRLTSRPVLDALTRASVRGVDVSVVVDRAEDGPGAATTLAAAGIAVHINREHPIAHDKVLVVDARAVETGSFNYTHQAESNAENCLVVRDPTVARAYLAHWEEHRAHARERTRPSAR